MFNVWCILQNHLALWNKIIDVPASSFKEFQLTAEAFKFPQSVRKGMAKAMYTYMESGKTSTMKNDWLVTLQENPSTRAVFVNIPVLAEVKEFASSVAYVFIWVKDTAGEMDSCLLVSIDGRDLASLDTSMVVSPNDERVQWFNNVIDTLNQPFIHSS